MPTRLSGGRVANPEGCPENPLRERREQVGRHPRRTCRLALRTKDPGEQEEEEEEEEEESLFKADAVNEEDSERDRATQV